MTMNKDAKAVIETEHLTKDYQGRKVVDDLSFQVMEREIFGFLGPNGAGKTTTILMLLGLARPTSGRATVCGYDPTRESVKVKRVVGYLPEHLGFYDDMTGRANLRYVAALNNIPKAEAEERIERALELVGLKEDGDRKVATYSRGMRQRLGLAEVLVKTPKAVLLDEPTLGLDPDGANRMIETIASLARDHGITVLFSSHDLDQVQKICDRVGIMIEGRMVAVGPMDQLAREKLGVGTGQYTLEELYMKYFQEGRK